MTEYFIPVVVAVLVPSVGWVVSKTISNDKQQAVHEAADAVEFREINKHLTDLKSESKDQTNKLDQLIAGMLVEARKSKRNRS